MSRVSMFWLGMCLCSLTLSAQKSPERLSISQQEIEDAARSRAPFLREMQERSRRGIFPDDELAMSLAEDRAMALVEVVAISPYGSPSMSMLTLQTDEVLRGAVPKTFQTVDYGVPANASNGILPEWGWSRVRALEHKKYVVAVQPTRLPEKPSATGQFETLGALDLETDESEWLPQIRRLLALEARSRKEGLQVLVERLRDESKLIRTRLSWKLAKACKLDSACWNATVDAEAELLQDRDVGKREEAINSFETLMVRSSGIKLTFEAATGKKRMVKEMSELSPPDFSIDKDVSAPIFRMGTVTVRSKGPQAVYLSPSSQKVRQLLEAELQDSDLAVGDEAYSLLILLRNGAPDYKGKCSFVIPALRRSFDYSGELPVGWSLGVLSLTHWSACLQ